MLERFSIVKPLDIEESRIQAWTVAESVLREVPTGPFSFQVRLVADTVSARVLTDTVRDVDALLRELEKEINPGGKRATWEWSEPDPAVQFMASANGASADTLAHVVSVAQEGFEAAASATDSVPNWPSEFSPEARKRAVSILRRLKDLNSLIVHATGLNEIEIRHTYLGESIEARPRPHRIFSSVDGVLRVLSGGDRTVWAGLREHRTNAYVRCRFDDVKWREQLGPLWEHRVVVEGMVHYDEDRKPRSIVDIKRVTPRKGIRPLSELAGTAPNAIGDTGEDEFVSLIRHG